MLYFLFVAIFVSLLTMAYSFQIKLFKQTYLFHYLFHNVYRFNCVIKHVSTYFTSPNSKKTDCALFVQFLFLTSFTTPNSQKIVICLLKLYLHW